MNFNRPIKALSLAGAAVTLLGVGVAMASPDISGATTQSSPSTSPTPVQVTNFPATQNVGGSVNVSNLPATQAVSGTVNVGNFPATQNIAGSVSVTNGTVGIDPSTNTVKLDPAASVGITAKTVPVLQQQYGSAGANSALLDVSAFKTLIVDAKDGALPAGCTVTITINDVVHPDNLAGGWFAIPNTSGNVDGYGLHMTVQPTSPQVTMVSSDSPVGCSTNVPLDLGIYGRPN